MLKCSGRLMAPLLMCVIAVGTCAVAADTKPKTKTTKAKTSQKETSKYHRLPTYFGQLELKDEQKTKIYSVREKIGPKIAALQAKIDKLKEDMDKEMTDVLTSTQKKSLAKLKNGGSATKTVSSTKAKKASAGKATSKKASTKKK